MTNLIKDCILIKKYYGEEPILILSIPNTEVRNVTFISAHTNWIERLVFSIKYIFGRYK